MCSCKKAGELSDKKPVMVDKNLETDREVTLEYELDDPEQTTFEITKQDNFLDLIEQKRAADMSDKVCGHEHEPRARFLMTSIIFRSVRYAASSIRKIFCSKSSKSMWRPTFVTTVTSRVTTTI